jgi:hypothetical protein
VRRCRVRRLGNPSARCCRVRRLRAPRARCSRGPRRVCRRLPFPHERDSSRKRAETQRGTAVSGEQTRRSELGPPPVAPVRERGDSPCPRRGTPRFTGGTSSAPRLLRRTQRAAPTAGGGTWTSRWSGTAGQRRCWRRYRTCTFHNHAKQTGHQRFKDHRALLVPGHKQPRRHGRDALGRTKASLFLRVAAHLMFAKLRPSRRRLGQSQRRPGAGPARTLGSRPDRRLM